MAEQAEYEEEPVGPSANKGDPANTSQVTDDADLLAEIRERYKEARDATSKWRVEAREDYDFVAGRQWTEADLRKLQEEFRPVITFNRIAPIVDTVCGLEVTNRQETRILPREEGDAQVSEIWSGAVEWAREQADAEDEESDAFWDATICGMGWTCTELSYDENPDGMIAIPRIDPLEMYWDASSSKKNVSDSRYLIRVRDVPLDFIEKTWPEKIDEIQAANLWVTAESDDLVTEGTPPGENYAQRGRAMRANPSRRAKDKFRLLEYQRIENQPYVRVQDPQSGQTVEMEPERFLKVMDASQKAGMQAPQFARQVRQLHYRAFVCGEVVLEDKPNADPGNFSYQCITGKRDRNQSEWYGVVRQAKDPQRWANKWLSQSLHIMNSNAKGGVMIEEGAVSDPRAFEESWADPAGITWVPPGSLEGGKITPKPMMQFPQGMSDLMTFAVSSIRDVTGISVEMLGLADRDQPASLEYQRRQAGVTILNTLFDSLRRYRKRQGRMMLYLLQNYLSDGRLVRLSRAGTEQYVKLLRDPTVLKYDVIVEEAPSSPNVKERTWSVLEKLLPALPQLGVPLVPELLDYAPIPQPLVIAWKKAIAAAQSSPQAQQQQAVAAAQQKALLQQQQAAADRDAADAQKARAQAQTAQVEANIKASPFGMLAEAASIAKDKSLAEQQQAMALTTLYKMGLPPQPPLDGVLGLLAAMPPQPTELGPAPTFPPQPAAFPSPPAPSQPLDLAGLGNSGLGAPPSVGQSMLPPPSVVGPGGPMGPDNVHAAASPPAVMPMPAGGGLGAPSAPKVPGA